MNWKLAVCISAIVAGFGWPSIAHAASNSWSPAGPDGARVHALAVDPTTTSTLYLGTWWGGLYRSINGGASWLPADSGLPNAKIVEIEVSPHSSDVVFAAADGWRLFKSTDGATTWVPSNGAVSASSNNWGRSVIAFHPIDPNIVYWARGASDCAVHKSLDGGATWPCADTGLPANTCREVIINPDVPDTLYADCSSYGVYKTVNGGIAWSESTTGIPSSGTTAREPLYHLTMDPASPDTLFGWSNVDATVYTTTDGAASWTQVSAVSINIGEMWHHQSNGKLFAESRDSGGANPTNRYTYFESSDSGATWTDLSPGYFGGRALAFDPGDATVYYAAMSGGLYKSTDTGVSWSPVNDGLRGLDIYGIAYAPSAPSTYYLGTPMQTLFRTDDSGLSFTQINDNLAMPLGYAIAVRPSDPEWVLASAHPPNSMACIYTWPHDIGMTWSEDGGDTWHSIADPLNPVSGVSMFETWEIGFDPNNPDTVFAASSYDNRVGFDFQAGVFKSIDAGLSWVHSSVGLPETMDVNPTVLAIVATSPTTLYFGMGPEAGFYRSSDAGASWLEISAGTAIEGLYVTAAAVLDAEEPIKLVVGTEGAGVFMSPDGGTTWSSASTGLPAGSDVSCLLAEPGVASTLYVGVNDWANETGGVYWSSNGGATWMPLIDGMGSQIVLELAPHPSDFSHLLAGTRRGLWEIDHWSDIIFEDGFESGDTTMWSVTTP